MHFVRDSGKSGTYAAPGPPTRSEKSVETTHPNPRTRRGHAVDTAAAWAAAALVPLAVLAGWLVVGALVARGVFRCAPRR